MVDSLDKFITNNIYEKEELISYLDDFCDRRYTRRYFLENLETIPLVSTYLSLFGIKLSNSEIFNVLSKSFEVMNFLLFNLAYAVEFYIDLTRALGLELSIEMVNIDLEILRKDYYEWRNQNER